MKKLNRDFGPSPIVVRMIPAFSSITDARVGLGHVRLPILDLSPLGHQPMASADGAVVLVFNGEIYNFRELRQEPEASGFIFHGHSDTAVLLSSKLTAQKAQGASKRARQYSWVRCAEVTFGFLARVLDEYLGARGQATQRAASLHFPAAKVGVGFL
jgi:glutamine phosphoribosylpyrophosphate amidotransferase